MSVLFVCKERGMKLFKRVKLLKVYTIAIDKITKKFLKYQ